MKSGIYRWVHREGVHKIHEKAPEVIHPFCRAQQLEAAAAARPAFRVHCVEPNGNTSFLRAPISFVSFCCFIDTGMTEVKEFRCRVKRLFQGAKYASRVRPHGTLRSRLHRAIGRITSGRTSHWPPPPVHGI